MTETISTSRFFWFTWCPEDIYTLEDGEPIEEEGR